MKLYMFRTDRLSIIRNLFTVHSTTVYVIQVCRQLSSRSICRGVHRVLVRKPEGKRPLGRPRRRWEDNIKMDLQEVGGVCGDWMELAQDTDRWRAFVSTVRNLGVPKMRGLF